VQACLFFFFYELIARFFSTRTYFRDLTTICKSDDGEDVSKSKIKNRNAIAHIQITHALYIVTESGCTYPLLDTSEGFGALQTR